MQDILLWELLRKDPRLSREEDLARAKPLLRELSELPPQDRLAFFAPIASLLAHQDPELRTAALLALNGAAGPLALDHLTAAFDDTDLDTARNAVQSFCESIRSDADRLIHALFHPRAEIRRTALSECVDLTSNWQRLFLLKDDAHAEAIHDALPTSFPIELVPTIAGLVRDEALSVEAARHLLVSVPRPALFGWLHETSSLSLSEIDAVLDTEELGSGAWIDSATTPSLTAQVFSLFWENSSEGQTFFKTLTRWAIQSRDRTTSRWLAAHLILAARAMGGWVSPALGALTVLHPRTILYESITANERRAALASVYDNGSLARTQPEANLRPLLTSELSHRASGTLDLWVLGAILHFAAGNPYALARKTFDTDALVDGFLEDPDASAAFFCLPDDSTEGARFLIEAIHRRSPHTLIQTLALLALAVPAHRLQVVEKLERAKTLDLVDALLSLESRPEVSFSDNKIRRLAELLAPRLVPESIESFLKRWFEQSDPHMSPFASRLLGVMAHQTSGEIFVDTVSNLNDVDLETLTAAIDHCAGFPYGAEQLLADKLRSHASGTLADWANERVPSAPSITTTRLRVDASIRTIPKTVADAIAHSDDEDCGELIAEQVSYPNTGLCEPLSLRDAPLRPVLPACVALLTSHDALDCIAREFDRFCSTGDRFLFRVDREMASRWERNTRLPVQGNAWLHLWDHHCFHALEQMEDYPGGLARFLKDVVFLDSTTLMYQIYRSVMRAFAMLRYRDRARLATLVTGEVLDRLVAALGNEIVGGHAATALVKVHLAGVVPELLEARRATVISHLPDISGDAREALAGWIESKGLGGSAARSLHLKQSSLAQLLESLRAERDPSQLEAYCRHAHASVVEEAVLLLVEMGADGLDRLAKLIDERWRDPASVPHIRRIIESIPLWPMGEASRRVQEIMTFGDGDPELHFLLARAFWERGPLVDAGHRERLLQTMADALNVEGTGQWFLREDWKRLLQLDVPEFWLARKCATSPHAHAYIPAVSVLVATVTLDDEPKARDALAAFLRRGTERFRDSRLHASHWLWIRGDERGFPLLLQHAFAEEPTAPFKQLNLFDAREPGFEELSEDGLRSALLAGPALAYEHRLAQFCLAVKDGALRQRLCLRLLHGSVRLNTQQAVVNQISRSEARTRRVHRLAQSFAWGVRLGRELTGRLFRVVMHGGEALGFTRLHEDKIHVTPLPILRGEANGRDVVEGLILHELGHQMYHRGEEADKVWKEAEEEQLHDLLNLVADEHLERNLRARDADFGDRLKRLASYAFQHSQKEVVARELLFRLGVYAFPALEQAELKVAKAGGSVRLNNGVILSHLEATGMSFARFMRALRMGRGNRLEDPKVAQALALFKNKSFRRSSMAELMVITRKLRQIFGDEVCILDEMDQHKVMEGEASGIAVFGEGLTEEELEAEVQRILKGGSLETSSAADVPPAKSLNIGKEDQFTEIRTVIPVPFRPELHAKYARQVAASARGMRAYFERLGLRHARIRFRTRGHRVDQARLHRLAVHSDPKVLIARKMEIQTDLFLGIVIDCSSSMSVNDNIEKAKLFATLLGEAARGLRGIELRVLGFTDSVIYDAGGAHRCAAHSLVAKGGNNDAAALYYAAKLARASKRSSKVLVMVSDGLPTECSVTALQALVRTLSRRWGLVCAQVAVEPLEVVCFPHYVLLEEDDLGHTVRKFGEIVGRLVRLALGAPGR